MRLRGLRRRSGSGSGHGEGDGGMDDDDDSATAAPSSSAAPKVVIKREPGEDNQFVKRLKQGEKIVIDLD